MKQNEHGTLLSRLFRGSCGRLGTELVSLLLLSITAYMRAGIKGKGGGRLNRRELWRNWGLSVGIASIAQLPTSRSHVVHAEMAWATMAIVLVDSLP